MTSPFSYTFPAIRGVQAGREFYVSMCPLRLLAKLFVFDNEELMPELRAQRSISRNRIPDIAKYILENSESYTFSAITASIDGDVGFEPVGTADTAHFRMGVLTVDMYAKLVVNDGQHRQAAIEQALEERPELGDETIAVVFFHDRGLERCQQMFADLNRHAVKPSPSLGVLYDHRNAAARVAKHLALTSLVFRNLVESERSSLSKRSRKLFTLSALHFAVLEMFSVKDLENFALASKKCSDFWEVVGQLIPEWSLVRDSHMTAGEVRQDFIHSHAIVLQALGRVGKFVYLIGDGRSYLKSALQPIRDIDWSRTNALIWEGRAMVGGRMAKNSQNITLTCNQIKCSLGLELTPEEQIIEKAFVAARRTTS